MCEKFSKNLEEELGNKNLEALRWVASFIDSSCMDYSLKKMKEDDYILLKDANYIKTALVMVNKGKSKVPSERIHTIKKSSEQKYLKFYEEKLVKIVERLVK